MIVRRLWRTRQPLRSFRKLNKSTACKDMKTYQDTENRAKKFRANSMGYQCSSESESNADLEVLSWFSSSANLSFVFSDAKATDSADCTKNECARKKRLRKDFRIFCNWLDNRSKWKTNDFTGKIVTQNPHRRIKMQNSLLNHLNIHWRQQREVCAATTSKNLKKSHNRRNVGAVSFVYGLIYQAFRILGYLDVNSNPSGILRELDASARSLLLQKGYRTEQQDTVN
ncbi:hypothetical protein Ciccas_004215 [Cichlidogyrus casuarinus]|uniref:Uncharacterized protein n=1 Tax=Cichlidogyrus casuarinus TaxID=1844966 RepID=A0ABD2QC51_9PLAT